MRPVRQNWQFCAQPTCEDMHSVVRCGRLELGRCTGIITASIVPAAPSPCTEQHSVSSHQYCCLVCTDVIITSALPTAPFPCI